MKRLILILSLLVLVMACAVACNDVNKSKDNDSDALGLKVPAELGDVSVKDLASQGEGASFKGTVINLDDWTPISGK